MLIGSFSYRNSKIFLIYSVYVEMPAYLRMFKNQLVGLLSRSLVNIHRLFTWHSLIEFSHIVPSHISHIPSIVNYSLSMKFLIRVRLGLATDRGWLYYRRVKKKQWTILFGRVMGPAFFNFPTPLYRFIYVQYWMYLLIYLLTA